MVPLAELTDVRVEFDGRPALRDASLVIDAGSTTAIVGANGSGKSTLLSVLAGVREPDAGAARFRPSLRRAFVPQRSAVPDTLPLSAREVVSMGRWTQSRWRPLLGADRAIIDEALGAVGMRALASTPLSALSGGQRQRVFVAQGLAQRAELLLLDEPTAGLDAESKALVAAAVRSEAERGTAVVYVTHDEDALTSADAVLHLHAGTMHRLEPAPECATA